MSHLDRWAAQTAKITRAKKPLTPEAKVMKAVVTYLKVLKAKGIIEKYERHTVGVLQNYVGTPIRVGVRGHSDIVCDLPGTPVRVFLEVKRADWKAPKSGAAYDHFIEQKNFIDSQRAKGHFGGFVTSALEVAEVFRQAGFTVPQPPQRGVIR